MLLIFYNRTGRQNPPLEAAGTLRDINDSEHARLILFRSWYLQIADLVGCPQAEFHDPDMYFKQIAALYDKMFKQGKYDYSIVVLDQANILESTQDAGVFKIFCEKFQGTWENLPPSMTKRILILCLGNLDWANLFHLGETRSLGIFPNWIEYGNEWTPATLREVLERRIRYALKEENGKLVQNLVTDKLVTKLYG